MPYTEDDEFIGDPERAGIPLKVNLPLPRKGLTEEFRVDLDDIVNRIPQRNWIDKPLELLSYGGGVQSTAMLVMITKGILPKPDLIMFSDTGSELQETLDNVKSIGMKLADEAGVPFAVVSLAEMDPKYGRLHEDYHQGAMLPMIGIRSCTQKYKIRPGRMFLRRIVGQGNGKTLVHSWLGITTDEARRRSDSTVLWQKLVYPLLDDIPTSRQDCKDILKEEGLEVIKSGCFMCPYSSTNYWKMIQKKYPDLWKIALKMEEQYSKNRPTRTQGLNWATKKWLKDMHFQASFGSFFDGDDDDDDMPSCDSDAGCFI